MEKSRTPMRTVLIHQLHRYLVDHNPELIVNLRDDHGVSAYLEDKLRGIDSYLEVLVEAHQPAYIITELCMNILTEGLRPSRYLYLKTVLEDEFSGDFLVMEQNGTLLYELINMITVCNQSLNALGFNEENEDNRFIRYAVIGQIREYLMATR